MSKSCKHQNFFTATVSLAVFLFYALNQSIPSGYSYGAGLLLLLSLFNLSNRPWSALNAQDKSLIWILLAVFGTGVLSYIAHGNALRELDTSSRFLLVIPVFLLLIKWPPRAQWLWAGMAVGGYSSAGVAIWQLYGMGLSDVDGLTNGVRYGAISTMLGILCVAGLVWTHQNTAKYVWLWRLLLSLGALGAWYGSLMSGTRGAWIALPVVFMLFCLGLFNKRNLLKATIVSAGLVLVLGTWISTTPNNPVKAGYRNAVVDISDFFERGIVTGSISGRFAVWNAALTNIPNKPLLGWGVAEYRKQLNEQIERNVVDPYVVELSHTHNLYLETLLYKGAVGLLAILALFALPFWYFCQRLR